MVTTRWLLLAALALPFVACSDDLATPPAPDVVTDTDALDCYGEIAWCVCGPFSGDWYCFDNQCNRCDEELSRSHPASGNVRDWMEYACDADPTVTYDRWEECRVQSRR